MTEPAWTRKDLLGIGELSVAEIELILNTAESFAEVAERPVKKVPTLRGKTVVNLFFEPSTRTRVSFEIAAQRLRALPFAVRCRACEESHEQQAAREGAGIIFPQTEFGGVERGRDGLGVDAFMDQVFQRLEDEGFYFCYALHLELI